MKRGLALLMAAMMLAACALAEEAAPQEKYTQMPYFLRMTQKTVTERVKKRVEILKTYPDTMNDAVDEEIRALVDAMAERARAQMPALRGDEDTVTLDTGALISRTGTSFMSFLTLAEITASKTVTYTDYDARVYDMETGERVTLGDIFPEGSEGWDMLSGAVRAQLTAACPGEEPDQAALERLCSVEALREAPFTMGGVSLRLHYRADALYPGRNTLLHVTLYYPEIRPYMTEAAFAQTDNSRFTMVALTYDDGGGGTYTNKLMSEMRNYGSTGTFFLVGRMLRRNHYNLQRQQNAGYSLQYHSYTHPYGYKVKRDQAFEEKALFESELAAITGVTPALMRAPGGDEEPYEQWEIGYPLIHWSLSSTDSGNPHADKIAERVIRHAKDGDIILMHDINDQVHRYNKRILDHFNRSGILTVTVEELFARDGIALEENKTYFSPNPRDEAE